VQKTNTKPEENPMNNIKYIGIDVHQATSVFAVSNREGRIIAEAILETGEIPIIDFLKSQRGTLWVTFEEGTYANWLYDVIKPHVTKLVVCDPRKIRRDGSKTDKIDARKLADLLRSNSLKAIYHGENGSGTLKELARSYIALQQDSTRVKNRIKAIFRGRGIACKGQAVYGTKKRQEWLQKLEDRGARLRAQRLLEELALLGRLRLEAQKDMVRESRKHSGCKILRKIPGLGSVRAALILAFVMTPYRFRTKRQFWTYVGLAVVTRGSGEYEIVQGKLTRSKKQPLPRGLNHNYNRVLKDVFKAAAITAAGRGPFKKLFDARIEKGIPSNLAVLTMARKISSIALALWKKGEPFDLQRHALSEQTK
jgi:transposase